MKYAATIRYYLKFHGSTDPMAQQIRTMKLGRCSDIHSACRKAELKCPAGASVIDVYAIT